MPQKILLKHFNLPQINKAGKMTTLSNFAITTSTNLTRYHMTPYKHNLIHNMVNIQSDGEAIDLVQEFKYLGFTVDNSESK